MKKNYLLFVFVGLFLFSHRLFSQQAVSVEVYPNITQKIKGDKELDRKKYFNLAANANELVTHVDQIWVNRYVNEFKMTLGRRLNMVYAETKWGKTVIEDINRPGYADISYLANKTEPNDNGMDALKAIWGNTQGLALHDSRDTYPDFMEKYDLEDADGHKFPVNTDAASELSANILKYSFTDFQRPDFYELVNEPSWKYWGQTYFHELHTKTKQKVADLGLNTKVGGPCYSVSNFYNNEFQSLSQLTSFIDNTNFLLDFYSFHSYDYMSWDESKGNFYGGINSGLPLTSVFDALSSYTFNKYGKELKYVASEHGGYMSNEANREVALNSLGEKYFPGTGFDQEMEKRSIENFIMVNSAIANTMVFMDFPYVVEKAVPFILLETSAWDTHYYSSLLVKENFDKSSSVWRESHLIDFYEFFKDVKGRRVRLDCNDSDIQHHAFVDGKNLILVFHNQSDANGSITIDVKEFTGSFVTKTIRRLGRKVDFRPSLTQAELTTDKFDIGAQESVVVFLEAAADISEQKELDLLPYYSNKTAVKITGSENFTVKIPEYEYAQYAEIRVGISRSKEKGKQVDIWINGTQLSSPIEDCADRITDKMYSTTRIIKVSPALLKAENTIKVSFADGGTGGVGAVVIRAAIGDEKIVSTPTGLSSLDKETRMKIYPNPASNNLTIQSTMMGHVQILDLQGKVILEQLKTGQTAIIPIEHIKVGNYLVRLKSKNEVQTCKLNIVR